jgi:hypothetical protein
MSHAATNWAIQQRGLKPTTKIVLWHLCDRFNPDYGCFPTQSRLAHDCEISRATLNRHLDDLEQDGLVRRIRTVDTRTGQQRPTRYLLGFEPGFTPRGPEASDDGSSLPSDLPLDPDGLVPPCPDMRHGPEVEFLHDDSSLPADCMHPPCLDLRHGPVSQNDAIPCLKNCESRVSNRDTNLVREPLSKPVKEEEGACPREAICEDFFEELISTLNLDPDALPGWWQGWPAREHVRRWSEDLGLDQRAIIAVAAATRQDHPEPPDGPKALDRAMQRAARAAASAGSAAGAAAAGEPGSLQAQRPAERRRAGGRASIPSGQAQAPRPSAEAVAAFYAELVNSDRYLPVSAISNTLRDAMLSRGLVTPERLRMRGVR